MERKKMKILIVEDNNRKFDDISSAFEECGETDITRRISRNGALKEIRESLTNNSTYDLIILDMQIPIYDDTPNQIQLNGGMEVFERIQRWKCNAQVAFCSSEPVECDDAFASIHYKPDINLTPLIRGLLQEVRMVNN